MTGFAGPAELRQALEGQGHLVDEGLATALNLAVDLDMPLLLEGEPGVGKTGAATALARALGARLLRVQCYEGLGPEQALYEWNYQRQLLAIRLAESRADRLTDDRLFTEEFLEERPLLAALRHQPVEGGPGMPLLLIDEIDRADDEFEALLLEFLGERSISIPELGTISAAGPMVVVLTSNRSRELHDALRRRCLYHWIEFPPVEEVARILRHKVAGADEAFVAAAAETVRGVRALELEKPPGMAEAIDWVRVMRALKIDAVTPEGLARSVGALAKTPDDRAAVLAAAAGGGPT